MSSPEVRRRARRRRSRLGAAFIALLRTRITTGVLTILPIALTLWVVRIIFGWMRGMSQWVFELILHSERAKPILAQWHVLEKVEKIAAFEQRWGFRPENIDLIAVLPVWLQWCVAIFSVLLTVFFLYVIGLFAANLFGRRIIETMEQVVDQVPLVKTIYRLPKQVITTFSATQRDNFRKAALIPFPQERMRCVGFITNVFRDSLTGEELCSVFIPTTPNPTTGYLQILKRKDLTELDWSAEDAIRTIMSGGILKPDFLTIVPNKELPPSAPTGGPVRPVAKAEGGDVADAHEQDGR